MSTAFAQSFMIMLITWHMFHKIAKQFNETYTIFFGCLTNLWNFYLSDWLSHTNISARAALALYRISSLFTRSLSVPLKTDTYVRTNLTMLDWKCLHNNFKNTSTLNTWNKLYKEAKLSTLSPRCVKEKRSGKCIKTSILGQFSKFV